MISGSKSGGWGHPGDFGHVTPGIGSGGGHPGDYGHVTPDAVSGQGITLDIVKV